MNLRSFGQRSGFEVPPVNIGAMRLPRDANEAVALIRHAIDSGMRYIDTSRGYGESEWILGRALRDGYRRKVILSSKWASWITRIRSTDDTSADCVRRRIDEQLKRLDVDYLDFYQIWNIDSREHYEQVIAPGGMLEGILKARDEGLVGHVGFTTHDSVENLVSYVQETDWCEIILFTYNLLNRQYAPAIAAAHRQGIGTVIMNPVGGGRLAEASPVLLKLAEQVGAVSVPDLAIRYVLSDPNIDTIISGLSRRSDVDDSIASARRSVFTPEQMKDIEALLDGIASASASFCTGCKYCLPCPKGIAIPAVMASVFDYRHWGLQKDAAQRYAGIKEARADACVQCGECEPKCTQHLKIMEEMRFATEAFKKG
jgi:hypothetical protein